jgi:hypothetical protein
MSATRIRQYIEGLSIMSAILDSIIGRVDSNSKRPDNSKIYSGLSPVGIPVCDICDRALCRRVAYEMSDRNHPITT